jgi:small nuclear ribonucleoprotein (snRNP)-like protein
VGLSANQKEVVTIQALGSTVRGKLKGIDVEKRTVTVTLKNKGEDDQDQTYTVAKHAKVFIDDKEALFNALATEDIVVMRLSGDQKEVGMIQTEVPSVQGILVAVDNEKSVITLSSFRKGEQIGAESSYPVKKDAQVFLYGKEAKLNDLAKGLQVVAKLSRDRKEVGIITAQGPTVQGVVKAVDAANNTVTVLIASKGKAGEEKTFNVVKEAPVTTVGEKTGRLADLEKERPVILWLSADQTMVVSISSPGKK